MSDKNVQDQRQKLITKYGADTPLHDLPESELHTGGDFTAFLHAVSGTDQSAYVNMRDGHAWHGTVSTWVSREMEIVAKSAAENCADTDHSAADYDATQADPRRE